jgi:hypothetical protein
MEYDEFGLSKVSSGTAILLYFSEEVNSFVIIEGRVTTILVVPRRTLSRPF